MIKQCARCHADFDAHRRAKYCPTCRPLVHKEQLCQAFARWRANHREQARKTRLKWYYAHREQAREYSHRYYYEVVKPRKVKEQKIKHLREHLANISAKCKPEPEPERHWADELSWTLPFYF